MGILVIMGKSGVGKDTVCNHLVEDFGMKRIVTYTTRPMREGEVDGVSYHFLTQKEFDKRRNEGFFAETRDYHAIYGDCSYGTSVESLKVEGEYLAIITPEGYFSYKEQGIDNLVPVYLTLDESLLRARLFNRANKEQDLKKKADLMKEVDRRLEADAKDFECLENAGIFEVDTDDTPKAIAELIYKYYKLAR